MTKDRRKIGKMLFPLLDLGGLTFSPTGAPFPPRLAGPARAYQPRGSDTVRGRVVRLDGSGAALASVARAHASPGFVRFSSVLTLGVVVESEPRKGAAQLQ